MYLGWGGVNKNSAQIWKWKENDSWLSNGFTNKNLESVAGICMSFCNA